MIESKQVADFPGSQTVIDILGFPYRPPYRVGGSVFYPPNITNAARLIAKAQSSEELARAGEIYQAVVELELHRSGAF